jgi:hypothetical protein
MLLGTLRPLALPPGLIEEENGVSARSDFGCDLIEMKLHGLADGTSSQCLHLLIEPSSHPDRAQEV